ncbi:unnamed protein product [Protopolystoma xenopodis]|uniref:Uncharacterized protein n=1 Tax=Protopolystoma xenopodis TaxID=117903 RepID=A0A3S5ALI9_9PLAT|nr:unnamed protein product [Protopolystoma xenopodis]
MQATTPPGPARRELETRSHFVGLTARLESQTRVTTIQVDVETALVAFSPHLPVDDNLVQVLGSGITSCRLAFSCSLESSSSLERALEEAEHVLFAISDHSSGSLEAQPGRSRKPRGRLFRCPLCPARSAEPPHRRCLSARRLMAASRWSLVYRRLGGLVSTVLFIGVCYTASLSLIPREALFPTCQYLYLPPLPGQSEASVNSSQVGGDGDEASLLSAIVTAGQASDSGGRRDETEPPGSQKIRFKAGQRVLPLAWLRDKTNRKNINCSLVSWTCISWQICSCSSVLDVSRSIEFVPSPFPILSPMEFFRDDDNLHQDVS